MIEKYDKYNDYWIVRGDDGRRTIWCTPTDDRDIVKKRALYGPFATWFDAHPVLQALEKGWEVEFRGRNLGEAR